MIRITCDTCGAVKRGKGQEWIIGYDLQYNTPRAVGRTLSFFDRWNDSRVLERGAVHFCSPECKEQYIAANTVMVAKKPRKLPARKASNTVTVAAKTRKISAGAKKRAKVSVREKRRKSA